MNLLKPFPRYVSEREEVIGILSKIRKLSTAVHDSLILNLFIKLEKSGDLINP